MVQRLTNATECSIRVKLHKPGHHMALIYDCVRLVYCDSQLQVMQLSRISETGYGRMWLRPQRGSSRHEPYLSGSVPYVLHSARPMPLVAPVPLPCPLGLCAAPVHCHALCGRRVILS